MNILDEPFKEEPISKPPWWRDYLPKEEWKDYLKFVVLAGCLLLYLFMRSPKGSDLDAILILLALWLCFVTFILSEINKIGTIGISLSTLLFFIFLTYTPSFIELIHPSYASAEWRWSHFELIFKEERTPYNSITEWFEWLFCYTFLALLPVESFRIWRYYQSTHPPQK